MELVRGNAEFVSGAPEPESADGAEAWTKLRQVELDPSHLLNNRIITVSRSDPAVMALDVLRTRVRRALKSKGWTRVGVTSPTQGCGKSFLSANLALSLARVPSTRTILVDMDLRIPTLAPLLGISRAPRLEAVLRGQAPALSNIVRPAVGLAVACNRLPVADAAELLQDPATAEVLDGVRKVLKPDVVIYDLPPMLACDDVVAFLGNLDCILLVVAGGTTKVEHVQDCERLLADQCPILGVVLNKSDEHMDDVYGYGEQRS